MTLPVHVDRDTARAAPVRVPRTSSPVPVPTGVTRRRPGAGFPSGGGAKGSFFGDLKAHGREAFDFFTDRKVFMTRWE